MGKAGKFIYAVKRGRTPGLYETWPEAEAQVKGFGGPVHKKFRTAQEAQEWLDLPIGSTTNKWTAPRSIPELTDPSAPAASTLPVPTAIGSSATPSSTGVSMINARDAPAPLVASSSASVASTYKAHGRGQAEDSSGSSRAPEIIAYTDGAAKNNQDKEKRIAGYGIHWASGRPSHVAGDIGEPCPGPAGEGKTNNYGELMAIIRVLELTKDDPRSLIIYSDSRYSIDCFMWHQKWALSKWKNSSGKLPANLDLVRYMVALRGLRDVRGQQTAIEHVKGHASSQGNICADALANQGAYKAGLSEVSEPDWIRLREQVEEETKAALAQIRVKAQSKPAGAASSSAISPSGAAAAASIGKIADVAEFDITKFDVSDILDSAELEAELAEA